MRSAGVADSFRALDQAGEISPLAAWPLPKEKCQCFPDAGLPPLRHIWYHRTNAFGKRGLQRI